MAVILNRMGLEVELVTLNFGVYPSWKPAFESASLLGFKHKVMEAEDKTLEEAVKVITEDGFPNNGINLIHKTALELLAKEYVLIGDGTRRDDKVPKIQASEIRSFEDRNNVEYTNLQGFGYRTIDRLSSHLFEFKKEKSSLENNSDYEIEVRCLLDEIHGKGSSSSIFPLHYQTRVMGWKK